MLLQGGFARYDEPSDEIADGLNNNDFHKSLEANPKHPVFHPPQGKIKQANTHQTQPRSYAFSHLSTKEECTYCCGGVSQNRPHLSGSYGA